MSRRRCSSEGLTACFGSGCVSGHGACCHPLSISKRKRVVTYSLVKTAADESGDHQLAREAQWLRRPAEVRSLEGQVPRLLDEGTNVEGRRFLVMSVAHGWAETRAFTAGHERF